MDTDPRVADCLQRFSRVLLSNFSDILSELGETSIQYTYIESTTQKKLRDVKLNIQRVKSANDIDIILGRQLCGFDYSAKPMTSDLISNTMLVGKIEQFFWDVDGNARQNSALSHSLCGLEQQVETKSIPEYNVREHSKFGQPKWIWRVSVVNKFP